MTDRLRIAVVGTGTWGEQHARIFSRRSDTDLVAVVGRNPERTGARASVYGTEPYTDIDQMLAEAKPDLVTVCLPNEGHFDVTLQLIRAGVPLLVEKQLVFDMLEHLVGPITSVMAQMTDMTYGDWSTVAIALEFEGGAVGTMLGSYDSSYAYQDSQLVEINGTGGRLVINDTVRELSIQKAGDEVASVWRAVYFNDDARSFHGTFDRHVNRVLAALRAGDAPPVHATAGRRALAIAHAAIESHETGTRVGVPLLTPALRCDATEMPYGRERATTTAERFRSLSQR